VGHSRESVALRSPILRGGNPFPSEIWQPLKTYFVILSEAKNLTFSTAPLSPFTSVTVYLHYTALAFLLVAGLYPRPVFTMYCRLCRIQKAADCKTVTVFFEKGDS